jgi:hypothetical protein
VISVGAGAIPGGGAGKRREEAASAPKAETKWRTASAVAGAGARRNRSRPAMPGWNRLRSFVRPERTEAADHRSPAS